MHKNFEVNPFLKEKEKGPKDGGVLMINHGKGDCMNNPRPHTFVTLSSGNCAWKNSSSASAVSNENISSTAIFNGNSKNTENSMQSSYGIPSAQDISAKSEVDTWRVPAKLIYTGEDEIHDAAQRTESSCSNSYFIHPICSSNDNYQETSMEAKSSVPNGCSCVVPTSAECSIEELVTGTVASGTTAQFTDHTQDKEEYSHKLDHALLPSKKGTKEIEEMRDNYRWLTGSKCSFTMNSDIIRGGTDYSADQSKMKISVETKGDKQACNKQDNYCSLYFKEEDLHPESALKDRQILAAERQCEVMDLAKVNDFSNTLGQQSYESLMTKHKYAAVKEENELVNGFDINDDIQKSKLNNHKQPISEAVSSSNVIRVMAKLGVPLCLPISTQKFRGKLGWRGTALTSAFCPASFPKNTDGNTFSAVKTDHSSKDSRGSTVIDLNLTAEEDCPAIEFPRENEKNPTVLCFKDSSYDYESGSKQEEKFSIDLNAPGNNADDCPQSSFPVNFTKSASMDLNLNDDPSIGEVHDDHVQWQRSQTSGIEIQKHEAVPTITHPREHLNILGPVYRADLSPMQALNHGSGQPFLVAAPTLLQPMERIHRFVPVQPQLSPYAMQVLPSHFYPSNGSFFISRADSLSTHNLSYGALPYTRDPHGHTVLPQVLNAGGIPKFPGAPYLLGTLHGQCPIGGSDPQPRYGVNSGDFSLVNGSWKENTRQLLIPCQNTELKFPQQAVTPTKRREPEGGWDAYQLGFKHTPSH